MIVPRFLFCILDFLFGMASRKHTLVPAEENSKFRKIYGKNAQSAGKTLIALEDFTKSECRKRKYSLKHQICLEILEGGFHESFSEMYHLFALQLHLRQVHGTDSAFYLIPLLETQDEKLFALKSVLVESETARRKRDYRKIYVGSHKLANYFLETGDHWLTEYFFDKALVTSEQLKEYDGGQAQAEATYHVAQCYERKDAMATAVGFYESFYAQSVDKSWIDSSSDQLLSLVAARCLVKSYTRLAEEQKHTEHAQLQKAYEIAKKSGDDSLIADSSYRLGRQILTSDRSLANIALKYFIEAAEASDKLNDIDRRCQAQRVLAQCYDVLGNKEKSLRALMVFRELAESAQNPSSIALAHLDFGGACNNDGDYGRAVASFTKAYTTALTGGQPAQLEVARAWVGVAMAHDYLLSFSQLLVGPKMTTRDSVQALAKWKASRSGLTKGPTAS